MRYNYLVMLLLRLASTRSCSINGFKHVVQLCIDNQPIVEKFDPDEISVQEVPDIREDDDQPVEDEPLLEPICSQTKGRKKATRIKSGIEEASSRKQLRKCAICNMMTNHDKRNHYKIMGQEKSDV